MGIKGGACACRISNYYKLTVVDEFYFGGNQDQKKENRA